MMVPPLWLRLHIRNRRGRVIRLWFPLFLVWVLALVLVLPLVPLFILAAILLWPTGWGRTLLLLGPAIVRCVCALRGFRIDVESESEKVFISFS